MGLVFFSFSVGAGCMITYGAYIDDKTELVSSTFWIVVLSLLISLMAGLMILPANFAFGMDPAGRPRPDIHYDAGDLCQAAFRVPVLYCSFSSD